MHLLLVNQEQKSKNFRTASLEIALSITSLLSKQIQKPQLRLGAVVLKVRALYCFLNF